MKPRCEQKSDVLVADSDPDVRELVKIFLKKEGFKTIKASSGPNALAMMRKHDPDLVLLEVKLSKFDGWKVLRTANNKNLIDGAPFLLLSEVNDEFDLLKKKEIKWISGHVRKPIEKRELLSKVKAELERKKNTEKIKQRIRKEGECKELAEVFSDYIQKMAVHECIVRKLRNCLRKRPREGRAWIESLIEREKRVLSELESKTKKVLYNNGLKKFEKLAEPGIEVSPEGKRFADDEYMAPSTRGFSKPDFYK